MFVLVRKWHEDKWEKLFSPKNRMKNYFIQRIEESRVTKRVDYQIVAKNKKDALRKLKNMEYSFRESRNAMREDQWKPQEILEILQG